MNWYIWKLRLGRGMYVAYSKNGGPYHTWHIWRFYMWFQIVNPPFVKLFEIENDNNQEGKAGNSELKPCPFCGHPVDECVAVTPGGGEVYCPNCTDGSWTPVLRWNKRAMPECVLDLINECLSLQAACTKADCKVCISDRCTIKAVEEFYAQ